MKHFCDSGIKTSIHENVIPQETSHRITAVRWIAIVLIVMAHSFQNYDFLREEMPFFTGFEWSRSIVFDWLTSIFTYGTAHGVVPVFFFFSAYLQFIHPKPYLKTLMKRTRTILVPMLLWTIITVVTMYLFSPWMGLNKSFDFLTGTNLRAWLSGLFGDYSQPWTYGAHTPAMFQFWFLRDIFLLSVLSPLIHFVLARIPGTFLCFCLLILFSGYRPIIVGGDALFFYVLGAYCGKEKIDFFHYVDRCWPWPAVVIGSIVVVIYGHMTSNKLSDCFAQIVSALMLMRLSQLIARNKACFPWAEKLGGQSFFLYCAHGSQTMQICAWITLSLFPICTPIGFLASVFAKFILDVVLCTTLGVALKRYTPAIFALLSGGR